MPYDCGSCYKDIHIGVIVPVGVNDVHDKQQWLSSYQGSLKSLFYFGLEVCVYIVRSIFNNILAEEIYLSSPPS